MVLLQVTAYDIGVNCYMKHHCDDLLNLGVHMKIAAGQIFQWILLPHNSACGACLEIIEFAQKGFHQHTLSWTGDHAYVLNNSYVWL